MLPVTENHAQLKNLWAERSTQGPHQSVLHRVRGSVAEWGCPQTSGLSQGFASKVSPCVRFGTANPNQSAKQDICGPANVCFGTANPNQRAKQDTCRASYVRLCTQRVLRGVARRKGYVGSSVHRPPQASKRSICWDNVPKIQTQKGLSTRTRGLPATGSLFVVSLR